MDVLRAGILICHAKVERERLRRRVARLEGEQAMAGEIRDAMKDLRKAHQSYVAALVSEIRSATIEALQAKAEDVKVVQMPRAMLAQTRKEVQEIRDEYAGLSNGDPDPSPLPGTSSTSSEHSAPQGSEASEPPPAKPEAVQEVEAAADNVTGDQQAPPDDPNWRPASDDHLKS